jgi:hypothetical protein
MNKVMERMKRGEDPEAPSAEVATLIEIRDLIAQRGAGGV